LRKDLDWHEHEGKGSSKVDPKVLGFRPVIYIPIIGVRDWPLGTHLKENDFQRLRASERIAFWLPGAGA